MGEPISVRPHPHATVGDIWGMGRMWHWEDGSLWYVTIPLPPLSLLPQPTLAVIPLSATINTGGTQQFDAIYEYSGQVNLNLNLSIRLA